MSQIGDDRGRGMLILPSSQQNKTEGKERGRGIYSCSRQWNVFDKPDEQRLSLLRLCHGEKTSVFIRTFSISQMSRDQACSDYGMARPDDKLRAISSSLEYCRGAEEEDEVNFRSSESRTLSVLNCYAECRRKSSSIKRTFKNIWELFE